MVGALVLAGGMIFNKPKAVVVDTPIILTAPEVEIPERETKKYRYIDCPLSKELQQDIFKICDYYGVSFEFVMAVIDVESDFVIDAVGDNGVSVGLMQIQEKWHYGLMEELGVTNLYDPIENIAVGVALLHSYIEEGKGIDYALMKYNGGAAFAESMTEAGEVSDYAIEVVNTAAVYENEI